MFISENQARAFRHMRADMMLTKTELAKKIGVTRITLSKIERGNYKAPKRIYQSVMDWLTEDLWRQQKKALTPTKVSSLFLQNTKHKLSAGKQDNQGVAILIYYIVIVLYISHKVKL